MKTLLLCEHKTEKRALEEKDSASCKCFCVVYRAQTFSAESWEGEKLLGHVPTETGTLAFCTVFPGLAVSGSVVILDIRLHAASCLLLFLSKCIPNVCFAGGRDKRGGPILTFPARSNHDRIRQEDLRRLISYLACIPR